MSEKPKPFRPIRLAELHRMIIEAGYHCTDSPRGRFYGGAYPAWSGADYDDAADRLATAILDRVNEYHRMPADDHAPTQEPNHE